MVHSDSPQRLFFALWPSPTLQEAMAQFRDTALVHADHVRPIPEENLHLTLAFLGATDAMTRDCYEAAATNIGAPAFSLSVDAAGFWRRSEIVWCGCATTPPALATLHQSLVDGLVTCGFRPESRPFAAHVTLARNVRRVIKPLRQPLLTWNVSDFYLVKSTTYAGGATYDIVRRWPLSSNESAN